MFLKKLLFGLLPVLFLAGGLSAQVVINEILIDLPGADHVFSEHSEQMVERVVAWVQKQLG